MWDVLCWIFKNSLFLRTRVHPGGRSELDATLPTNETNCELVNLLVNIVQQRGKPTAAPLLGRVG
jgi:hypothetical protein